MIHNFNAGPSVLPQSVFQQAASAVINFNNTGLSILEIGHRTPGFIDLMEEARALVKELMSLDDNHEVLFLHGGASTQFMQVPMNLLDNKETAAYTDTGVWGAKAIKEAALFGKVDVVCSSKDQNYSYIPKDFAVPNDAKFLHITTNNTIYGTQWQNISFTSNDLIYAGAQKNMGAAGVNIVIVNKNILGKVKRRIPTMMDYRNHIAEESILNTPPVFAVFVCLLTLRWLKAEGGIAEMEKRNNIKSEMLYNAIDNSKIFKGTAAKEDRSKMNVCFVMDNKAAEAQFLEYLQPLGIVGIKGHRSVGGFRASLYNALESRSVEVLVKAMNNFEHKY